jgi:predicted nucleic acid-binding protein
MSAIADTSYVLAVAVETDKNHGRCLAVHRQEQIVYLPQSTLAEFAYLLTRDFGNAVVARFLIQLPQTKYRLIALEPEDILHTANLLQQYADSRVDFVDASIAAVAERLKITRILTLDQRDFRILRPKHATHFELLPVSQQP